MTEFQENVIGAEVELALVDVKEGQPDQPMDLTNATDIAVRMSMPGGPNRTAVASIKNPSTPTDGLANFFTTDGLMVPSGDWEIQADVTFSSGEVLPSKVAYFTVKPNVKPS